MWPSRIRPLSYIPARNQYLIDKCVYIIAIKYVTYFCIIFRQVQLTYNSMEMDFLRLKSLVLNAAIILLRIIILWSVVWSYCDYILDLVQHMHISHICEGVVPVLQLTHYLILHLCSRQHFQWSRPTPMLIEKRI